MSFTTYDFELAYLVAFEAMALLLDGDHAHRLALKTSDVHALMKAVRAMRDAAPLGVSFDIRRFAAALAALDSPSIRKGPS